MANSPSITRIAVLCVDLAGAGWLSVSLLFGRLASSAPPASVTCKLVPPNVQLGAELSSARAAEALEEYGNEATDLIAQMQPGDTVHPFQTATTGGHAVMRGNCYIGRVTSWLR